MKELKEEQKRQHAYAEISTLGERNIHKQVEQYQGLIQGIYFKNIGYFPSAVDKAEFKSYIEEQFIRLVIEFGLSSEMDFPGYAKIKLTRRVQHYIQSMARDKNRMFSVEPDVMVGGLMDTMRMVEPIEDYHLEQLVETLESEAIIDSAERIILTEITTDGDDRKAIQNSVTLLNKERDPSTSTAYTYSKVRKMLKDLRAKLQEHTHLL